MKWRIWIPIIGLALGAAALPLAPWVSSSASPQEAYAQEGREGTPGLSETRHQMRGMVDATMGEGASERMHEGMPGSEEMMELCSQHLEEHEGNQDMMGMMSMMSATGHTEHQPGH